MALLIIVTSFLVSCTAVFFIFRTWLSKRKKPVSCQNIQHFGRMIAIGSIVLFFPTSLLLSVSSTLSQITGLICMWGLFLGFFIFLGGEFLGKGLPPELSAREALKVRRETSKEKWALVGATQSIWFPQKFGTPTIWVAVCFIALICIGFGLGIAEITADPVMLTFFSWALIAGWVWVSPLLLCMVVASIILTGRSLKTTLKVFAEFGGFGLVAGFFLAISTILGAALIPERPNQSIWNAGEILAQYPAWAALIFVALACPYHIIIAARESPNGLIGAFGPVLSVLCLGYLWPKWVTLESVLQVSNSHVVKTFLNQNHLVLSGSDIEPFTNEMLRLAAESEGAARVVLISLFALSLIVGLIGLWIRYQKGPRGRAIALSIQKLHPPSQIR